MFIYTLPLDSFHSCDKDVSQPGGEGAPTRWSLSPAFRWTEKSAFSSGVGRFLNMLSTGVPKDFGLLCNLPFKSVA